MHNDLWDFDIPMAPTLIDFPRQDGTSTPALVVGTKAGQIFVLDRHSGQPLTKVEDIAVKPGHIPGENMLRPSLFPWACRRSAPRP